MSQQRLHGHEEQKPGAGLQAPTGELTILHVEGMHKCDSQLCQADAQAMTAYAREAGALGVAQVTYQ